MSRYVYGHRRHRKVVVEEGHDCPECVPFAESHPDALAGLLGLSPQDQHAVHLGVQRRRALWGRTRGKRRR